MVAPESLRAHLVALWREILRLLVGVRDWARVNPWRVALALGPAAVVAWAVWPYDHAWSEWFRQAQSTEDGVKATARALRRWGAFIDTPVFTVILLVLGWRLGRPYLSRAALACLLAACCSGLTANLLRFTTGRPRPRYTDQVADGFYGPRPFNYNMQSFPSGHVATSVGNAVGLSIACPPLAPIALASAIGVTWSCVYLRAHWPTDAAVSVSFGLAWGVLIGTLVRRRNRAGLALGETERAV